VLAPGGEKVMRMLKILADGPSDQHVTLRLDGLVAGRWVNVLRESCEAALNRGAGLTLDLANVSFVDREGGVLIRSLRDRQVRLENTSLFVAEQIRRAAS
jgi:hypothetical protein